MVPHSRVSFLGSLFQGTVFLKQAKEKHSSQQGQEQLSRKPTVHFAQGNIPQPAQNHRKSQTDQSHIGLFHKAQHNGSQKKQERHQRH